MFAYQNKTVFRLRGHCSYCKLFYEVLSAAISTSFKTNGLENSNDHNILRFFQTLHNFFTGAHYKVADDAVNRICQYNNKLLGSNNPGVKLALIALDSRIVGAKRFVVITTDSVHHIIRNFVQSA